MATKKAPTLTPEILTALWRADYANFSGDQADLFAAASSILGRDITADTLTINAMADVSAAVQAEYWALVDPLGQDGRDQAEAEAEAGRAAAVQAFPPQNVPVAEVAEPEAE